MIPSFFNGRCRFAAFSVAIAGLAIASSLRAAPPAGCRIMAFLYPLGWLILRLGGVQRAGPSATIKAS